MGTEKEMAKVIRDRFPEIFLATAYATKGDRKVALLQCIDPQIEYTIEQLRGMFTEKYNMPISRVAINSYVNELEAEGKLAFIRQGLGGQKRVSSASNDP